MQKIYVTGIPGSGKSTLAHELHERGIAAFDIDQIPGFCYWRNRKTHERREKDEYKQGGMGREWVEAHEWRCDAEVKGCLIGIRLSSGITSNQEEYLHLFEKFSYYSAGEKLFTVLIRTNQIFGKQKSEQESILSWYKQFEERMIKTGAIPISTEQPISAVADVVMSVGEKTQR